MDGGVEKPGSAAVSQRSLHGAATELADGARSDGPDGKYVFAPG